MRFAAATNASYGSYPKRRPLHLGSVPDISVRYRLFGREPVQPAPCSDEPRRRAGERPRCLHPVLESSRHRHMTLKRELILLYLHVVRKGGVSVHAMPRLSRVRTGLMPIRVNASSVMRGSYHTLPCITNRADAQNGPQNALRTALISGRSALRGGSCTDTIVSTGLPSLVSN